MQPPRDITISTAKLGSHHAPNGLRELARRWKHLGIASNTLNPGNVRSRITRNNWFLNALHRSPIARMIIMSEADGARTSLLVATSPDLEGVTGRYFDKVREAKPSKVSTDAEAARRLWEVSQQLVDAV